MSSLEMVSYIKSTRAPGEAELRHDTFMLKVPKVLGSLAPELSGTNVYASGRGVQREQKIYNFPKREAMLMAMSYSYNLQAQIFDAWEAAKAALVKAKALLDKFLKKFFTTSAPPGKLISQRKKSICHAVQIRFDYLREGLVELR